MNTDKPLTPTSLALVHRIPETHRLAVFNEAKLLAAGHSYGNVRVGDVKCAYKAITGHNLDRLK